jgi:hypothetical protein
MEAPDAGKKINKSETSQTFLLFLKTENWQLKTYWPI